MDKKLLEAIKDKLEKEKTSLEEQLSSFAKKDPNVKGDWDAKYPRFDGDATGASLETAADEVEEYESRLPVEYSLETKLRDTNLALEKIKEGKYDGVCENCGKKINEERLKIYPSARLCLNCQNKQ